MASVVFPGTFDPPTFGHLDLLERTSRSFEKVYVLVAVNSRKEPFLSLEERRDLLIELAGVFHNVQVFIWKGFIVDFMREKGVNLIVRGVRSFKDFSSEFEMHLVNQSLDNSVDTIWLPSNSGHVWISSSTVKMLFQEKKEIVKFVPPLVAEFMSRKFKVKEGIKP